MPAAFSAVHAVCDGQHAKRRSAHAAARLLTLLLPAFATAVEAQDSSRTRPAADSARVPQLSAVQVIGSVLHVAGPAVTSGMPARSTIIDRASLESRRPRLLSDALARESGVSLYDDLGSPSKVTLSSRGFTASPVVGLPQGISVFLDGVPVNEPDAGQVNFDLLPVEHIERVEFLSGTASLLGPHSLGGAINLMTRHNEANSAGEIALSAGSNDSYAASISHGGGASRGVSYYAGGGYSTEGGWRQLTAATNVHGLVNVGVLGARNGVRLQVMAARSNAETAGSLPVSVYGTRPDSNLSAGDFEDIDQIHVALSAYRAVRLGRTSGVAYLRSSSAERFNVNQVDDPDVRSFSDNRSIGGNVDWRAVLSTPIGTLAPRFGMGGSAHTTRVRIHAERIDPRLTTDIESPIAKLDMYAVADLVRGPVTLSGGARYDAVRVPFRNRLDAARDTTSVFRRLSPRLGASLALGSTASIYVSAGQSFRAPAVIELACADPNEPCPLPFALGDDPPLNPVVATTWEAGSRWGSERAVLGISAYRTAVRDDIFLFPYNDAGAPSGSTIDGFFANVPATRRVGLEATSNVVLGPLRLTANYGWTRATFEVDDIEIFSIREEAGESNEVEKGDQLPLIPNHVAAFDAELRLPYGVAWGVESRYTGARFLRGDEANETSPLDAYVLIDMRLGVGFGSWEVQAIVRNVADVDHATFGTFNLNQGAGNALERFLTPGPPRTTQLVVRRRIGR